MPKFQIVIQEDYTAHKTYEIEAADQQEASDKASELHAESETPVEDIQFIEWNINSVEEIKD